MKSIEYLYDLVGKSCFTTIGYSSISERIKDEFISKLPHLVITEEIDSSFSIRREVRNIRINSLLNEEVLVLPEYLVVDYQSISFPSIDDMSRYTRISETLENLRSTGLENNIKIIFTSPIYKTAENLSIKGGQRGIYMADLVLMIEDDNCTISKNRFSHGNFDETISLNGL